MNCLFLRFKAYFRIGRLLLTDLSLCFYWFKHPSKCNLSSSHCKFLKRQFALDDVETFNFAIGMQDWASSLVRVWSMKNCVLFFVKTVTKSKVSSHCMFSRILRIRIYDFFSPILKVEKKNNFLLVQLGMQDWAASLFRVWPMKNSVLFCKDCHEIQSFESLHVLPILRIRIYIYKKYWITKKKCSMQAILEGVFEKLSKYTIFSCSDFKIVLGPSINTKLLNGYLKSCAVLRLSI